MGGFSVYVRLVIIAVFASMLLGICPPSARAQTEQLAALEKEAQDAFKAEKYAEALDAAERMLLGMGRVEATPGKATAMVLTNVAWYALFVKQPAKALAASERALELAPDYLIAASNRAHALLFLNRIDAARAAYIEHKGEFVPEQANWEVVIGNDFTELRKRGLDHPSMADIEKAVAAAPVSAKTQQRDKHQNEWMSLLAQIGNLNRNGRYAEALPLALRLVAISERTQGTDSIEFANDLGTLADVQAGLGQIAEAEAGYKRSIAILEAKGGDVALLLFLPNRLSALGGLYFKQDRYAEAEPLLKRGLALRERLNDKDGGHYVGIEWDALGKLYTKWGRYTEAETAFNNALRLIEQHTGRDSVMVGAVLNNLANLYSEQGRYAEAETYMLRAIQLFDKGSGFFSSLMGAPNPQLSPMLGNLADIYRVQGRYDEAEGLLKRALALGEKDSDKAHLVIALNNLATFYAEQGRYLEAEALVKRSLDIGEKIVGRSATDTATQLGNLASVYLGLGRHDDAEALEKRVLTLRETVLGKDHADVALALSNLAITYIARERYKEAEPLLQRALAIREKAQGRDHPDVASALDTLATLYSLQKRPAEAEPLAQRALAINEKAFGRKHTHFANSKFSLGIIYMNQGRFVEAVAVLNEALSIWESTYGPEHAFVGSGLNALSNVYLKQQDWTQAVIYAQKAIDIAVRRSKRGLPSGGAALQEIGQTEIERGTDRLPKLVKSAYRLSTGNAAEAPRIAARMFETAQWAHGSTAAQSLAKMAARKVKGAEPLARLIREQQDLTVEWQVKDRLVATARSLPDSKRDATVEDGLRKRMAEIDARLAEIATTFEKNFPDYASFASPEPLTIEETQRLLKDNEALVLFLDTADNAPLPEETFIWVVTKTATKWVRAPLGTKSLTREVQALRCGLDYPGAWGKGSNCAQLVGTTYSVKDYYASKPLPFDPERAHELYRVLFGQIEDMIRGKRLLIVASGPLSRLPFQVLVTKAPEITRDDQPAMRQVQWLVRSNSLTVLPAVSSLKALRRDAKASHGTKPYFGIGNPLLDGSNEDEEDAKAARLSREKQTCPKQPFTAVPGAKNQLRSAASIYMQGGHIDPANLRGQAPLPETADELCAVAHSVSADSSSVLLGAQANETHVKTLSEQGALGSYRIVHFATHGALAGEIGVGSEPGLLLTPPQKASDQDDGYLSASEIINLKFDADWVILSACNTAGGDKDNSAALSGLARAFFYSGARSLLVSHWSVNSAATVKLMTSALAAIGMDSGLGRAEAMQRATLALIDKGAPYEAHPSYWAPFVVAGEGSSGR